MKIYVLLALFVGSIGILEAQQKAKPRLTAEQAKKKRAEIRKKREKIRAEHRKRLARKIIRVPIKPHPLTEKSKKHAKEQRRESYELLQDRILFGRFVHQMRIYLDRRSNAATKTAAALNLVRLEKHFKTKEFKERASNQLKRHKLSAEILTKRAHEGKALGKFGLLTRHYAGRKHSKRPTRHLAVRIVQTYDKQLTGEHKKIAENALKRRGIDLAQVRREAKEQPQKSVRPAPVGHQPRRIK